MAISQPAKARVATGQLLSQQM